MAGTDELDVGAYGGGGAGGVGGGGGNFSSPPTVPGPTSSPSTHNDAEVDKEATAAAATAAAAAVAVDGGLFSTSQMVLWVPHATIALLLIGLVTASFVRFHSKHGHKYRKPSNPAAGGGAGGGGGGLAHRDAPVTAWGMHDQDNAIVDMRGVGLDGGQSPVTMDASGGTMAMTPGRTPPHAPPPLSPTTNPPLDPHPPLDDDAGAVQIDWWDSGLTPCSSSASAVPAESPLADCRVGENSGRLQSSSGGVCNPVESGGRRGGSGAGGGRGGGGLEAPRALFSVWTLRRGRVGDIVCLPKAISKPLRVSAGDCTTDECHELLLEKL